MAVVASSIMPAAAALPKLLFDVSAFMAKIPVFIIMLRYVSFFLRKSKFSETGIFYSLKILSLARRFLRNIVKKRREKRVLKIRVKIYAVSCIK